jgi:ribosomal protein L37AE/L43A
LSLANTNKESEMRCPGCKRFSLSRKSEGVSCSFCGYRLSPGEEARYRLYELLK